MINFEVYSPVLAQHAAIHPPAKLYHYTSADALIGIVSNKEIWATNTSFLNDATEVTHAIELTRFLIIGCIERNEVSSTTLPFANMLYEWLGTAAARFYVASFTELQDSLSQWRAYCPVSGGYTIGLPSAQIHDMAVSQGFMLVKCIYDFDTQQIIINEVLNGFFAGYENQYSINDTPERLKNFVIVCRDYMTQLALLMKHSSFQEEQEWRLIAANLDEMTNPGIFFRGSNKGIIPYYKFKLVNDKHPNMVVRDDVRLTVFIGPSPDRFNRQLGLQFLLSHYLGFEAAYGSSDIPYKTW